MSLLRLLLALPLSAVAAAVAQAQTPAADAASNWLVSYSTSTQVMGWTSTYGYPAPNAGTGAGSGTQIYSSHGLQATGRLNDDLKLQLTLRSGAIWSQQNSPGFSGTFSGITDTSLSSTLTYYGFDGIQPFVALSTNVPTGSSTSSGFRSKMDSDISKIPNFGEGLNLGGTLGANIPLTQALIGTLSFGYIYRGAYASDGTLGNANADWLKPGDVATLTASLNWKEGPWSAQGSAVYAFESRARLAGVDYFRSGDRFTLSGALGYAWSAAWSSKLSGSWTRIGLNELYVTPPGAINLEPFNSNGDVFTVGLSTAYTDGAWTLSPNASLLYRNRNAYDPVNLSFVPAKTTASLGLGLAYAITRKASLNASLAHTWAAEDPRDATATPQMLTRVWTVGFGGTVKF